jgi:hypothetical protein
MPDSDIAEHKSDPSKVSVHDLLLAQQKVLKSKLLGQRDVIVHSTAKGTATEVAWAETIGQFLPQRYQVAEAFVIDARSNVSEQLDVVIYDRQYCPLFFEVEGARYIPAESVYAVFEAKQDISAEYVKYAGEKAASVRRLHRTNMPVHTANGIVRKPNDLKPILAGILTLDSGWSPPLGEPFEKALMGANEGEALDLGCVLEHGGFVVDRDDVGARRIVRSEPVGSLMFFLQNLYSRLQAMATVPVMDLGLYARTLQDDGDARPASSSDDR